MNAMELGGVVSIGEGTSRWRWLIYRGSVGKEEGAWEIEGCRGKGKGARRAAAGAAKVGRAATGGRRWP
jgi:hypothetical protein